MENSILLGKQHEIALVVVARGAFDGRRAGLAHIAAFHAGPSDLRLLLEYAPAPHQIKRIVSRLMVRLHPPYRAQPCRDIWKALLLRDMGNIPAICRYPSFLAIPAYIV